MRTLGTRPTYWDHGPEHGYHPAPKHYPAWAEHEAAMRARASELFARSDAERKLIRQRAEHMVEAGAPAIMASVGQSCAGLHPDFGASLRLELRYEEEEARAGYSSAMLADEHGVHPDTTEEENRQRIADFMAERAAYRAGIRACIAWWDALSYEDRALALADKLHLHRRQPEPEPPPLPPGMDDNTARRLRDALMTHAHGGHLSAATYAELGELGLIDSQERLTDLGRAIVNRK